MEKYIVTQKLATFPIEKSAENVKNNDLKTEKDIFSLLNVLKNYRKILDCSTR